MVIHGYHIRGLSYTMVVNSSQIRSLYTMVIHDYNIRNLSYVMVVKVSQIRGLYIMVIQCSQKQVGVTIYYGKTGFSN